MFASAAQNDAEALMRHLALDAERQPLSIGSNVSESVCSDDEAANRHQDRRRTQPQRAGRSHSTRSAERSEGTQQSSDIISTIPSGGASSISSSLVDGGANPLAISTPPNPAHYQGESHDSPLVRQISVREQPQFEKQLDGGGPPGASTAVAPTAAGANQPEQWKKLLANEKTTESCSKKERRKLHTSLQEKDSGAPNVNQNAFTTFNDSDGDDNSGSESDEELFILNDGDGTQNPKYFSASKLWLWYKNTNVEFQYLAHRSAATSFRLLWAAAIAAVCGLGYWFATEDSPGVYLRFGIGGVLVFIVDACLMCVERKAAERACNYQEFLLLVRGKKEEETRQGDAQGRHHQRRHAPPTRGYAAPSHSKNKIPSTREENDARRIALSSTMLAVDHPTYHAVLWVREAWMAATFATCVIEFGIRSHQLAKNNICVWAWGSYDGRPDNVGCPFSIAPIVFLAMLVIPLVVGKPRFVVQLPLLWAGVVASLFTEEPSTVAIVARTAIICTIGLFFCSLKYLSERSYRLSFETAQTLRAQTLFVAEKEQTLTMFLETLVPLHLRKRIVAASGFASLSADIANDAIAMCVDIANVGHLTHTMLPHQVALQLAVFGARCAGIQLPPHTPPPRTKQLTHIRSVGDTSIVVGGLFDKHVEPIVFLDFAQYLKTVAGVLPMRCGIAEGVLLGLPIGRLTIRYDVFGPALQEAQALLASARAMNFNIAHSVLQRMDNTDMLVFATDSDESSVGTPPAVGGAFNNCEVNSGSECWTTSINNSASVGGNSGGSGMGMTGSESATRSYLVKDVVYNNVHVPNQSGDSRAVRVHSSSEVSMGRGDLPGGITEEESQDGDNNSSWNSSQGSAHRKWRSFIKKSAYRRNTLRTTKELSQPVVIHALPPVAGAARSTTASNVNTTSTQLEEESSSHLQAMRRRSASVIAPSPTKNQPGEISTSNNAATATLTLPGAPSGTTTALTYDFETVRTCCCCHAFRDRTTSKAQRRHLRWFNRTTFGVCALFFGILDFLVVLFYLLEVQSAIDAPGMIAVPGLLLAMGVKCFPAWQLLGAGGQRVITKMHIVLVIGSSILSVISASLTRPSAVGDSVSYLSITVCTTFVFSTTTLPVTMLLESLWVVAFWCMSILFRRLIDMAEVFYGVIGLSVLSMVMQIFHQNQQRRLFRDLYESQQALALVEEQGEIRKSLVEGTIPKQIQHRVSSETVKRFQMETWGVETAVVMCVSFFKHSDTGGAKKEFERLINEDTDALRAFIDERTSVIEHAVAGCTYGTMALVNVFCGTAIIAGPLEDPPDKDKRNTQLVNAMSDALEVVTGLLESDLGFTIGLAAEQSVNVLRQTEFPAHDVFGPVVNVARALMIEAPSPMVVMTDVVASFFERECLQRRQSDDTHPTIKAFDNLSIATKGETWRIRGVGAVRLRRAGLKTHNELPKKLNTNRNVSSNDSHISPLHEHKLQIRDEESSPLSQVIMNPSSQSPSTGSYNAVTKGTTSTAIEGAKKRDDK